MCLSTVYSNEISEANAIMENVMIIDCDDTSVTMTDLMGRRTTVEGKLVKANLTDGFVIIKTV